MASFTNYASDRAFTNKVHDEIAIPEIYRELGWRVYKMDPVKLERMDLEEGIDYVMLDRRLKKVYVQERFREYHYHRYTDATLRYRRDHNSDADQIESEFYKIKADYLVYGIINASKRQLMSDEKSGSFVKYAVIDLHVLFKKIEAGLIVLDKSIQVPVIRNGKMYAPINENRDYSSSFVAFDIAGLNQLFGRDNIIVAQKGFF